MNIKIRGKELFFKSRSGLQGFILVSLEIDCNDLFFKSRNRKILGRVVIYRVCVRRGAVPLQYLDFSTVS